MGLAAAVNYVVPTGGTWGAWTTIGSMTIGADEIGYLEISARIQAEIQEAATGGGSRVGTEMRVQRTRGSSTVLQVMDEEPGLRNIGGSSISSDFAGFTRRYTERRAFRVLAAAADVFTLQAVSYTHLTLPTTPYV